MEKGQIQRVALIGAGNVAWHLGSAFTKSGIQVIQVYNRSAERGTRLARKLNAGYISSLSALDPGADLCLVAVSESAIPVISDAFPFRDRLLVHTSGTVDMSVLKKKTWRAGVLYPLQTFSGRRPVNFSDVPICIEASIPSDLELLAKLASLISKKVYTLDSVQRRVLHMAAVFAGNFTNFMYTIAEDLLKKHRIPFDLLRPLIRQTAINARHDDVFSRQTGPAMREENKVMEDHRELLARHAVYMEIYELMSKSIIQYKLKDGKL